MSKTPKPLPPKSQWATHANSLLISLKSDTNRYKAAVTKCIECMERQRSNDGSQDTNLAPVELLASQLEFYKYLLAHTPHPTANVLDYSSEEDEDDANESDNESNARDDGTAASSHEHNNLCQVCDQGGHLICCSGCNLVFHGECTRPKLQQIPEGEWYCGFCILERTKKSSVVYKRALAGVREMERKMRERKDENNAAEHDTDDSMQLTEKEVKDDSADFSKSNSSHNLTPNSGKKRKAEPDTGDSNRSKRERKPPKIYDPQSGPAKLWRSDQVGGVEDEEEGIERSKEGSSSKVEGLEMEEVQKKKKVETKPVNIWCELCQDNPDILVCAFCACRVCFGKHKESKVILCDECDDEYHIFCLSPPLSEVPENQSWYCQKCAPAPKRRRGRPPKVKPPVELDVPKPPKRPVGRPPKNRTLENVNSSDCPSDSKNNNNCKRASSEVSSPSQRSNSIDSESQSSRQVAFSRSGRIVKLNPKLIDYEEGEQHLKTEPKKATVSRGRVGRPPKSAYLLPQTSQPSELVPPSQSHSSTIFAKAVDSTTFSSIPQQQRKKNDDAPQVFLSPITGLPLSKEPRRKPGARECMQISRRFGVNVIPDNYMEILLDYCTRGKVEHLIRMRERLDEHSKFLECQLAGLEEYARNVVGETRKQTKASKK